MQSSILEMDTEELAQLPMIECLAPRVHGLSRIRKRQLYFVAVGLATQELLARCNLQHISWRITEREMHKMLGLDIFESFTRSERTHIAAAMYLRAFCYVD